MNYRYCYYLIGKTYDMLKGSKTHKGTVKCRTLDMFINSLREQIPKILIQDFPRDFSPSCNRRYGNMHIS